MSSVVHERVGMAPIQKYKTSGTSKGGRRDLYHVRFLPGAKFKSTRAFLAHYGYGRIRGVIILIHRHLVLWGVREGGGIRLN